MTELSDERKAEVLRLRYVDGLSVRAIARRLSMARRTVRRLLGTERRAPRPPAPARTSILAPFEELIRTELRNTPELRAPAMLERLRPLGYTGGVTVLRDRMRKLRPRPHIEVFSSFTTRPAERLEVDWANLGYLLAGVPRTVSAFVAVMAHSRMLYVDFTLSQQMGAFLRCMDRALDFFGGRTAVDVFDNMKTVVIGRVRGTAVLHSRMIEYARVRGFAVMATRPATPTDKPFVERGIGFVRTRFLPGRRYADLADLRLQGQVWRDAFANRREHEVTGKVPALVFEHEEKPLLSALRDATFDTDDLVTTTVGRVHRVHFDRNDYTVPWRLAGQTVLVRGDDDTTRVFLASKEVARHARAWGVRELVENKRHEDGMRSERARSASVLPDELGALGAVGARYFAMLAAGSRSLRTETVRLVLLTELFGSSATQSAVEEVMQTGHVGADYVEYVLRHKRRLSPRSTPLRLGDAALDAIAVPEPDLAVYDEICARRTRDPGEPPPAPTDRSSP